jgi:Protein of unknown function (DUF2442)
MEWWEVDLKSVRYASDYRVHVRYNRSLEADIDLSDLLKHRFYAPIRDKKIFAKVKVDAETGVLVWPGDIDMAPEITFERAVQAAGKNQ